MMMTHSKHRQDDDGNNDKGAKDDDGKAIIMTILSQYP